MKILKLRFLSILLLFHACSGDNVKYIDMCNIKEFDANIESMSDDLSLGYPMQMEMCDTLLIVMDWAASNNTFFYIYNQNGVLINTFGKKGRGRGEIISPNQFFLDVESKVVTLYQNGRITYYDIGKIVAGESDYAVSDYIEKGIYPISNYIPFDSGDFFLGFTQSMRFMYRDSDQVGYVIDSYPKEYYVNDDKLKPKVLSYGDKIYFSPNKDYFVQATYIGALLETFEISATGIQHLSTAPISAPIYECHEGGAVSWTAQSTIGFDNISTLNDGFFALLNNNKGENLKTATGDFFAKSILFFDWNAQPHYRVNVGRMLVSIAASSNSNICYAISYNEGRYSMLRCSW